MLRKNSLRVTVPMHTNKIIPKGTLLAILRQAKISKKEFLELL
ncbi:MAG: type II toxin-antitoxin system HicA family toxin [Proteobacteria bacterium]|nr:type II toxin-antitoxin system HicA family toxin [Pseudomonadota bacterium]